jgi:uncharacterized protein YeaO (DUF488 family)
VADDKKVLSANSRAKRRSAPVTGYPLTVIALKRVYEKPSKSDGFRILVERLWPRGLAKEKASVDLWLKEIAPSPELRKWYSHDIEKWKEFRSRYTKELKGKSELLDEIKKYTKKGKVTFVYAAHDEEHNSALVLRDYLGKK